MARLVLGSASPRRREILETLGIDHVVVVAPVDEATRPGEDVDQYLCRIVKAKLGAVCSSAHPSFSGAVAVLVADTTVVLDDSMLAKPESVDHAREMIRALSGRAHEVKTAFAIGSPEGKLLHEEIVVATVVMRTIDVDEIEAYAASGEGMDKAGGYAVQGRASAFVSRIEGSFSCVVGLPACELTVALRSLGLR
jgi:septum formation protein